MTKLIPISSFTTEHLPIEDQFAAWRQSMAPFLDVSPYDGHGRGAFYGAFESYLVGPLVVGGASFDAHGYGRGRDRLADGVNHYHLNLHLEGGVWLQLDGQELVVGPGDITLLDYAQPFTARSQRSTLLVIAVPRDALEALLPPGARHGQVLRAESGLAGLLADHMKSLAVRLPTMTLEESAAAATGSIALIGACFRPQVASFGPAAIDHPDALAERVRHYIAAHLDQDLSVEAICRQFPVSRPTLYRLFAPHGGVVRYVRNQRLSRAFTALMNPNQRDRRISEIGFEAGYQAEAPFSRAFRAAFGLSPREVRAIATSAQRPDASAAAEANHGAYRVWLKHLRRK